MRNALFYLFAFCALSLMAQPPASDSPDSAATNGLEFEALRLASIAKANDVPMITWEKALPVIKIGDYEFKNPVKVVLPKKIICVYTGPKVEGVSMYLQYDVYLSPLKDKTAQTLLGLLVDDIKWATPLYSVSVGDNAMELNYAGESAQGVYAKYEFLRTFRDANGRLVANRIACSTYGQEPLDYFRAKVYPVVSEKFKTLPGYSVDGWGNTFAETIKD